MFAQNFQILCKKFYETKTKARKVWGIYQLIMEPFEPKAPGSLSTYVLCVKCFIRLLIYVIYKLFKNDFFKIASKVFIASS